MLLVPGGGRQDDVGEQGRAGHPEVQREQQVELALRRVLAPPDVAWATVRRRLLRPQVAVGAEQVLEEVLVALARRAEQVGPPQGQAARPVLRCVRVLDREPQPRRDLLGDGTPAPPGPLPRPRRPGRAGCGRTAGTTASSPAGRTARWCRRCAGPRGRPGPAARRARRRGSRRSATGRCGCTSRPSRSSAAAGAASRWPSPSWPSRSPGGTSPDRRSAPSRRRCGPSPR